MLVQNEILKYPQSDISKELDHTELFCLFVSRRKVKLLRFLFAQSGFKFTPYLFQRSLELEAYDVCALLYKEFFRLLRDVKPLELEEIIGGVVTSFSRSNGMIDYKCYLAR